MSFPRYPAYKDSGVEWLGKVPEHWEVKRLRHAATLNPSKQETAHLDRATEVSFLPMEAIGDDGSLNLERTRPIGDVETGYTYFREGDVTLAKITPCFENGKGGIMRGLVGGVGFGTTELIVARPAVKSISSAYLDRVFTSRPFRQLGEAAMYGAGGQKRVPDDFVRDFAIGLPPLDEQRAIATFLDRETAKIDALVAEQEKLIELLKEKRQAVISHAVTKGLDPSVPMKDSGVEWLGEVPAHWSVLRLRYAAKLNPSKQEIANQDRATEVSFIPMEAIEEDGSLNLDRARSIGEVETGYTYFRDGDVAIAKITPCFENGKGAVMVGLTKGIGFGTTELIIVRPIEELVSSGYLDRMFRSHPFRQLGEAAMYGAGGQKRVPDDFVRNFAIGIPPRAEQTTISAFLHNEAAKLDGLVEKARLTIDLLQERRSALISAAVTGQIDVRGLADRMTTPDSIAAHADSTPTQGRFDSESAEHAA